MKYLLAIIIALIALALFLPARRRSAVANSGSSAEKLYMNPVLTAFNKSPNLVYDTQNAPTGINMIVTPGQKVSNPTIPQPVLYNPFVTGSSPIYIFSVNNPSNG